MSLFHAFRSLEEPVFRWWFLSQIFSASGSTTQMVAQTWLVLKLTGKGVDLGLLIPAHSCPSSSEDPGRAPWSIGSIGVAC